MVRGSSADVDRAVREILRVVEDAKNDAIASSYVSEVTILSLFIFIIDLRTMFQFTEFEIDREYVGRVVGAQGGSVKKLRDQLGVRVDVSDEAEEKEKESAKKKKPVHQKSKIKVGHCIQVEG